MPTVGAGFLITNDLLTDISYSLFEPAVNTLVPAPGITAGAATVLVWDASMYVGAQLVVGAVGASDIEVVTITAVNPGTSFTATFANNHATGEPIQGATFPVQNSGGDPLFQQGEMLAYLSTALNDFLTDVPLAYVVTTSISVGPTAQNAALPSDCMVPMRIAVGNYPLRETSQSNLDAILVTWQQQAASQPYCYFRDKVPLQNFGIFPRANNTVNTDIVYSQRGPQTLGLADGFGIPDPFLPYVKWRALEFSYSKDGEQKNPALARYWNQRYRTGCQISKVILGAIMDPNLEMNVGS